MLVGVETVAHVRTVGLHGHVVGSIQNPQQACCKPQSRAEGHEQQTDTAQDSANHEVGRTTPPLADGAVTHRADDGLHQQTRHRAGQPQQRQAGFIRT